MCVAGQRCGEGEGGTLREGAEEICEVLAVSVRPGRAVCGPQGQAVPEPSRARPNQSVRGMRLTSERAERGSWPKSQKSREASP